MNLESFYFPLAITLHVLSAVVWVGGMFFAYMALRPVAARLLEPPLRLQLWDRTFSRFFIWVWLSILLIPVTGYWMIFKHLGGFGQVGWYVHVMQLLGIVMILVFLHVFFAPYLRLHKAVKAQNYEEAGRNLGQIRKLVGINLLIGILVLVSVFALKYSGI